MAKIPATLTKDGNKITINPTNPLDCSKEYKIVVGTGLKDVYGDGLDAQDDSNTFTTAPPSVFLQDIDNLRNNLDSDLTLDQDLDFNDDASYDHTDPDWETKKTAWTTGTGWEPIGGMIDIYNGNFNGGSFTINNLFMDKSGGEEHQYTGLFGRLSSYCTISNIGLLNVDVRGQTDVGALVGSIREGHLYKCYSTGTISGTRRIGGLIGTSGGDDSTVSNCHSSATVTGTYYIGGLIGSVGNLMTISNSFSLGVITSTDYSGGFIGDNDNLSATITSCYYDSETSGQSDTGKGTPKTTAEMKQQATFTNWDFSTIWNIVEGITYPTLR